MLNSIHEQRIHGRVTKRLWSDLSVHQRDIIAADIAHTSEEFKWFEAKVNADSQRLIEDPTYYDNLQSTFLYPKHKQPCASY